MGPQRDRVAEVADFRIFYINIFYVNYYVIKEKGGKVLLLLLGRRIAYVRRASPPLPEKDSASKVGDFVPPPSIRGDPITPRFISDFIYVSGGKKN